MCKEFMIDGEYYCTLGSLRAKFGKPIVEKLLSDTSFRTNEGTEC